MRFLALLEKELRLLFRDKIGLVLLFLMPMAFVFIITLLQANGHNNQRHVPLLLINKDHGQFSQLLINKLQRKATFSLHKISSVKTGVAAVTSGRFKALIILPNNLSKTIAQRSKQYLIGQSLSKPSTIDLQIILDPSIPPTLKQTINIQIKALLQQYQTQSMAQVVSDVLGTPLIKTQQISLPIKISYAQISQHNITPNPVQQNIPAWALFGMFFIVVPLSSLIIQERQQGIILRLAVAPVSSFNLISSRFFAFTLINLLQLILMLLVGIYIMPLFGLASLNLTGHLSMVLLIGICSAAAATSFGFLIGTFTKTIEQASALGPMLIVIAAAIGGIMLPTYLMPDKLQILSQYSPLYWGQNAFIDVLVRQLGFMILLPSLIKLIIFSVLCLSLSIWHQHRQS